jgi:hypothetical protein
MEPEGMVHALTEIHRLLVPRGILIDIHPLPQPGLFEVRRDDAVLFSRPELDFSPEPFEQAQNALKAVVRRGLFTLEAVRQFDYFVLGSSVPELTTYLQEQDEFEGEPDDEFQKRREELDSMLQEGLSAAGPEAKVAVHIAATMSSLKAVP